MMELTHQLENKGISEEQARAAMEAIQEWLSDHYPVIATMARQVLTGAPADTSSEF